MSRLRSNPSLFIGLVMLALLAGFVALGQIWTPHDPFEVDYGNTLQPPSLANWFGTDDLGRDVASRVLAGGYVDLKVALICVVAPALLGVMIGAISGFIGGRVDTFIMRVTDIFWAFPFYVLVIAIVGVLGPGEANLYLAFLLVNWISFARIVRGEVLVLRNLEFVQAARSLGCTTPRIVTAHILPNAVNPAIVYAMADVVLTILAVTSLSFLGLGIQPPTPEWGLMISDGRQFLFDAWWIATFPGFAIIYTGVTFALIGEGLDTALRPKG
ncbi:peptide/nickel transport system permease protein [Bosea sp. OAE752]|uniref:ABC transporter permease n=1 Tax=unclassified Bosea (in: a-proteobacteria) TaxID=2653178 RepID=UPI0035240FF5